MDGFFKKKYSITSLLSPIIYLSHLFISWFPCIHSFLSKKPFSSLFFNSNVISPFCLVSTLFSEHRNLMGWNYPHASNKLGTETYAVDVRKNNVDMNEK